MSPHARRGGLDRAKRVRALMLWTLLPAWLSACSGPAAPSLLIEPIGIDSVDVLILESSPPRASAHVTGIIGDGCSELHSVEQRRTGATVVVSILRERPRDAICTQIAKLYDATIPLDGQYPPGPYELIVNGVRQAFVTQ